MEALTYSEVRNLVLSYYWMGCRNHAKRWTPEQILAWVSDEYENAFNEPLHRLMRELTMLGLVHGWFPSLRDFHHKRCVELISSFDLSDELSRMAENEADELVNDLRILGVLE